MLCTLQNKGGQRTAREGAPAIGFLQLMPYSLAYLLMVDALTPNALAASYAHTSMKQSAVI